MKCPKCGYISFDFNQVCPKCNKDISNHRDKMNFVAFRPSPPSLLGALTGETSDSGMGFAMDTPEALDLGGGKAAFSAEDSQAIEAMEEAFLDSQSLEAQIEATPEPGVHFPEEAAGKTSPDLEDLIIDSEEPSAVQPGDDMEEDAVSLDLEDLAGDETELLVDEALEEEESVVSLDLEETNGGDPPEVEADLSLDLESLSIEEESSPVEEKGTEGPAEILLEEAPEDREEISLEPEEDVAATLLDDASDGEIPPAGTGEESLSDDDDETAAELEDLDLELDLEEVPER